MRIIAGQYGGRQLKTPQKSSIHPMSERARAAIFNSLSNRVVGAVVLDAFAGSGALGLEALSRGAKHVSFLDCDRAALTTIRTNLQNLSVNEQAVTLISATLFQWFEHLQSWPQFDIIFADPPYHKNQVSSLLALEKLLKPQAYLLLSTPKNRALPLFETLRLKSDRCYAEARISWWQKDNV